MTVCINPDGSRAKSVALKIEREIVGQKLNQGARLLPLRRMAEKYDTSYLVVRKAVKLLCEKGVLSSRHGSGVYVRENANQQQPATKADTSRKTIAVVFCGTGKYILAESVYCRLLHGIEKEAARQNMEVAISLFRKAQEYQNGGAYGDTEGFLLIGNHSDDLDIAFKDKPAVWAMGTNKKWGDHVSYNNWSIGVLAAEAFVARGYKRLVSINVLKGHGEERCRAFNEHAHSLGADVLYIDNPEALILGQFEQHIAFDALRDWVQQIEDASPRPQGIFVVDVVAHPLYSMLVEKGIKPGRDVDIATSHWQSGAISSSIYRPINIDQHPEEVGVMAVRQLQWRIENPNARRMVVKIEPEIEKT